MESDTINRSFTQEYNRLQNAYEAADEDDADALNACIRDAKTLLGEPAIPRFHRIKTLLLLTSMVPDVDEASAYHREAEALWRLVRAYEPKGANVAVEEGLEELRVSMEELRSALEHDEDEDEGAGDKKGHEDVHLPDDVDVAIARQQAERLAAQQEEEEQERVDAEVLGMTVEEMRKTTAAKKAQPLPLRGSSSQLEQPQSSSPRKLGEHGSSATSPSSPSATRASGTQNPDVRQIMNDFKKTQEQVEKFEIGDDASLQAKMRQLQIACNSGQVDRYWACKNEVNVMAKAIIQKRNDEDSDD